MNACRPIIWTLLAIAAGGASPSLADDLTADQLAFFERQIRPLLADNCHKCHGAKKQESSLRLDAREGLLTGGENGPAIVPGNPVESLLIKAVRREGDIQMPPDAALSEEEIAALTKWIAMGAPWPHDAAGVAIRRGEITDKDRQFWSLRPVADPPIPPVNDAAWPQSPIDRFILATLEAQGLTPVGPASKRTLLRRATFDLTGLPPTIDEINAFLADDSPSAFAAVIDRLLASPAYGERWGRHWLDVVRYADTAGETADYPVADAYRYRNWVIDALNADKPYDEFIRDQIAGDILAQSAPRERYFGLVIATGYLAISRRFGFDSENYHHLTIADTIDTLGQSVLGLALGCARCHDHKFDAVTTRDYYALYGIFDSTRYPFAGSEQKAAVRSLVPLAPPAEAAAARETFDQQVAQCDEILQRFQVARATPRVQSLDGLDGDFELQAKSSGGSIGCLVSPWLFSGRPEVLPTAQSPYKNAYPRGGEVGVSFPAGDADHTIWQAIHPPRTAAGGGRMYFNLDFRNEGQAAGTPGAYRIYLGHGKGRSAAVELSISADRLAITHGDSQDVVRKLQPGTWYNVQLAIDLSAKTFAGTVGVPGDLTAFADKPLSSAWDGVLDCILIDTAGSMPSGNAPARLIDNVAVRGTPLAALPAPAAVAAASGVGETPAGDPNVKAAAEKRRGELLARGPGEFAYAVFEGTPHDARIHKRGEPAKLGDEVPRRFLEVLRGDPLPADTAGSGRLHLADWLTRKENSLTPRVMVNRIWQHHFGVGLVATENDFGTRGQPPSHPELLDYLASRFVADGWSIKAMHRLIMLSRTYQLASDFDARCAAADPANRLHWRFSRQRLDAELIRDAMLSLGGNLEQGVAGPHPFPPIGTPFTQHAPFSVLYDTSRRSVYLMTPRIRRHPLLALFDGADTNASTARRGTTTVPSQALFVMNDPFVHEQSARFAARLIERGGDDPSRISAAYQMALAREPSTAQVASGLKFLDRYRRQLQAANIPGDQHALASWSALARTLLASNEFLFVD